MIRNKVTAHRVGAGARDPEEPMNVRDRLGLQAMQEWIEVLRGNGTILTATGNEPCVQPGVDPEDWFDNFAAHRDETGKRIPLLIPVKRKRELAKELCNGCPLLTECLDAALDARDQHGVWGGTIPEDRVAMKRARRGRR